MNVYSFSAHLSHPYGINENPSNEAVIYSQNIQVKNQWKVPEDTVYRFLKVHLKALMPAPPFGEGESIFTFQWNIPANDYTVVSEETEIVELKIDKGEKDSSSYEIEAPAAEPGMYHLVGLLPIEVTPDVLAVNSDFDEGRIDPATGYAIPDCDDMPNVDLKTGTGNTKVELDAERNHLDGRFSQGDDVVDDLHKGWFGVNPKACSDEFWNGANITIRKIDKIDDDTGYKESGQVRFYAKWGGNYYGIAPYDFQTLQAVNLVSAGVNLRPNEGVYGPSSTIPDGAEFYMEGVRPGKITLEWRLQKGTIDVKHAQTFKVETRQTLAEWREEVRYQIRLQTRVKSGTEVDLALYHPGNGFRNTNSSSPQENDNILRVQAIYYYQQLFKQMPENFMWAGMAKTAAAPIYAGMSDMTSWWQLQQVPAVGGVDGGFGTELFIDGLLLSGQKAIYADKAWAHRAYFASSKWALDWLENENPDATNYRSWRSLYSGVEESDQDAINAANHDLLQREQRDVVQSYCFDYTTTKFMKQPALQSWVGAVAVAENSNGLVNIGEWLSANANKNPMPGGPKFRDVVPGGRIDNYQHRWNWTANSANGMLLIWTGKATDVSAPKYNAGQRLIENNKKMYSAAAVYSYDVGGLPIE